MAGESEELSTEALSRAGFGSRPELLKNSRVKVWSLLCALCCVRARGPGFSRGLSETNLVAELVIQGHGQPWSRRCSSERPLSKGGATTRAEVLAASARQAFQRGQSPRHECVREVFQPLVPAIGRPTLDLWLQCVNRTDMEHNKPDAKQDGEDWPSTFSLVPERCLNRCFNLNPTLECGALHTQEIFLTA